jgi:hypothetical protein
VAPRPFDASLLPGVWVHVAEEDTPDDMVFRPAAAALAPARGRLQLRLEAGDKVEVTSIGRGDAPATSQGTWTLGGPAHDNIEVRLETGEVRSLHITALEKGRLVVRKG